jgi:hypothetical protein
MNVIQMLLISSFFRSKALQNVFTSNLKFRHKVNQFGLIEQSTRLYCIDTQFTPLKGGPNLPGNLPRDDDNSWKTKTNKDIITEQLSPLINDEKPKLITFDAMGTLIDLSQSVGRWYREALNSACEMRIRLPRPALFTAAFKKAYAEMYFCFCCICVFYNILLFN